MGQLNTCFPGLVVEGRPYFSGRLDLQVLVVVDAQPHVQSGKTGQRVDQGRLEVNTRLLQVDKGIAFFILVLFVVLFFLVLLLFAVSLLVVVLLLFMSMAMCMSGYSVFPAQVAD